MHDPSAVLDLKFLGELAAGGETSNPPHECADSEVRKTLAASSRANFGIKGTLAMYDPSAVLDLKFLGESAPGGVGTSNPPH